MIDYRFLLISAAVCFFAAHASSSEENVAKDEYKRKKEYLSRRVFDSSDEREIFQHFNRENVKSSYGDRMLDYFSKNPVTLREGECFDRAFPTGQSSIDFVIDIAPSPSNDEEDVMAANSPIGQYLELFRRDRSPTKSYFDYITRFIDIVSYGLKPEVCHSVIVEKSSSEDGKAQKFYIRGRYVNETFDLKMLGGDFSDAVRNLKTLWPVSTRSKPETHMAKILVSNLGRMTKLALWNRDNGLPTVLNAARNSTPVYTIVISDGSSGLPISDLIDVDAGADMSRTSLIDIGNHRCVDRLSWDEVSRLRGVYTLTSPQTLPAMANSIRTMACLVGSNFQKQHEQLQPKRS